MPTEDFSHLSQIYARADRAHEHLLELQSQLEIFLNSNPCTVTIHDEPEKSGKIIRVELDNPSGRLAILAGDFVHSLRSALDNLVYSLATVNLGKVPTQRTESLDRVDVFFGDSAEEIILTFKRLVEIQEFVRSDVIARFEGLLPESTNPKSNIYERRLDWL